MLTEKENYLRMLRGEMPEFLPKYDMMGWGAMCSIFSDLKNEEGTKVNEFGVEYSITKESVGAVIPTPGKYVLDDITKWRDVIKT
ncbi:MAG: veratrol--corrinoid protein metyltransferase, partial [Oscillospiraceae bacterium]|nr:veratrol--corrinoid protein metyltransferase [Oscillospiraceae bacterium]